MEIKILGREIIEIDHRRNGVNCLVTATFLRSLKLKWEALYKHSVQVGLIAEQLGVAIGLEKESVRLLKVSGYLHDIGKLAITDTILKSPTMLNTQQWEQITKHPETGVQALHGFAGFEKVSKIILHHHEHEDGTGYPHGLAGDHIPVLSKLIQVSDVFSATSCERPYKFAFSHKSAINASLKNVAFNDVTKEAILDVLERIRLQD